MYLSVSQISWRLGDNDLHSASRQPFPNRPVLEPSSRLIYTTQLNLSTPGSRQPLIRTSAVCPKIR